MLLTADHGPHMGPYAAFSDYGFAENSLPALFVIAPKWFLRKYPSVAEALRLNQQRLLSNYDFYKGLKSLLRLPEFYDAKEHARVRQRSRKSSNAASIEEAWRSPEHALYHGADSSDYAVLDSLIGTPDGAEPLLDGFFKSVSPSRTCEEAGIPKRICTCNTPRTSF